jgi:hypothetical protein
MSCDRIAGPHKMYYSPFGADGVTYLGLTGPEGITQVRTYNLQEITSDEFGPNSIVDHVYQGQNLRVEMVLQEVNKNIAQMMMHPWTNTYTSTIQTAARQEDFGVPGRLGCTVYGVLEAIPIAFSPAQGFAGGSASGTAGVYPDTAATSPGSGRRYRGLVVGDISEFMDARARFVPIVFQCYPYVVSEVQKHWEWITTATTTGLTWTSP